MAQQELYPLVFEPQLRHYVWGGRSLGMLYNRVLPPGPTAESWEISGHAEAPTRVSNGSFAGRTLPELVDRLGVRLIGERSLAQPGDVRFPLLVKLLDAQRDLSIQVHPDDAYALAHENGERGKAEAWYILAAQPHARVAYGLAPGTNRDIMSAAVAQGSVADLLRYLPVSAGDCVFVPAGTVHAVMAGTVLAEIQQTSDATYRVFDWGRLASDGKPRALHIAQALDTIAWGAQGPGTVSPRVLDEAPGMRRWGLVECPQFTLERIDLKPGAAYAGCCSGETFEIWGCIEGMVSLYGGGLLDLGAVRFALLPAELGRYYITARSKASLLRAYVGPHA
jgi:mannose-6-phosphate isomerase